MCLAGTHEGINADPHDHHFANITRRGTLLAAAGGVITSVLPRPALAATSRSRRLVDLTHTFRAGFPVYANSNPTRKTFSNVANDGYYSQEWTFLEHTGTHLDAPGHFIHGGRLVPQITLEELMVPVVVVDISARAATEPDALVTPEDLLRFERRHGRIPRRAAVVMYSGWEARIKDQAAYRNIGADGKHHFPGFGKDAVEWLLEQRAITALGVDTLSLDNGPSQTFDVHRLLLGTDRYGLENLANLKNIPPRGAVIFVGVVPWEEGSGGPCRVVAQW
jgi:kynurenine formamidase